MPHGQPLPPAPPQSGAFSRKIFRNPSSRTLQIVVGFRSTPPHAVVPHGESPTSTDESPPNHRIFHSPRGLIPKLFTTAAAAPNAAPASAAAKPRRPRIFHFPFAIFHLPAGLPGHRISQPIRRSGVSAFLPGFRPSPRNSSFGTLLVPHPRATMEETAGLLAYQNGIFNLIGYAQVQRALFPFSIFHFPSPCPPNQSGGRASLLGKRRAKAFEQLRRPHDRRPADFPSSIFHFHLPLPTNRAAGRLCFLAHEGRSPHLVPMFSSCRSSGFGTHLGANLRFAGGGVCGLVSEDVILNAQRLSSQMDLSSWASRL